MFQVPFLGRIEYNLHYHVRDLCRISHKKRLNRALSRLKHELISPLTWIKSLSKASNPPTSGVIEATLSNRRKIFWSLFAYSLQLNWEISSRATTRLHATVRYLRGNWANHKRQKLV